MLSDSNGLDGFAPTRVSVDLEPLAARSDTIVGTTLCQEYDWVSLQTILKLEVWGVGAGRRASSCVLELAFPCRAAEALAEIEE